MLDGQLDGTDGSARAKAQIVKALKTMSLSLSYGNLVQAQLEKLPTWSAYKDQNHDLFISSAPSMPYLMGTLFINYQLSYIYYKISELNLIKNMCFSLSIILFSGVQSTGGYLTEGRTNSTVSNVPPPLIKKEYSPY